MNTKKEIQESAKIIFKQSLDAQGLDEAELRKNIALLKSLPRSSTVKILESLLAKIRRYYQENTLVLASADPLEESTVNQLKSHFEKEAHRSLNVTAVEDKNLIGGVKISLGDREWNFTIKERLAALREHFYV